MQPFVRPALGAVVLGTLLLGGCGGGGSDRSSGSGTPSASAASTGSASSTPPAPAPPTRTSSASAAPPRGPASCGVGDLRFRLSGGEGAAGSTYSTLRMTNTSGAACRTGGYGGVSLVASRSGAPIGAPADRVEPGQRARFDLAPGASAEATLRETDAGNYPRARCRPAQAHGLRVYPPDETRWVFVPHPTTACSSPRVHLLELAPYAPVH